MFIRWIFHGNAHLGVVCYHSLSQWVCWSSLQVIMMCSCFFLRINFHWSVIVIVLYLYLWQCDEVDVMYAETLREMKKMFAYLMESERKSYNPTNFCKVCFSICVSDSSAFIFLPGFYLYLARIEIKSSHFIWSHHGDKTRLAKTEGKELLP